MGAQGVCLNSPTTSRSDQQVGAVIAALRPGDHGRLEAIADRWGRPAKEVAGILLEEAIRRESTGTASVQKNDPRGPGAAA